jgi:ethanolamine utilization protein EutP
MTEIKQIKKRIMLAGAVNAGKTTLMRALFHGESPPMKKDKTQSLEYEEHAIDTPGEYTASPFMRGALFATALEADLIVFVQDATTDYIQFPPGFATGFPRRSVGVVTKIDSPEADVERALGIIRNVCVSDPDHIFCVSAKTGEGIGALRAYIDEKFKDEIRYRD